MYSVGPLQVQRNNCPRHRPRISYPKLPRTFRDGQHTQVFYIHACVCTCTRQLNEETVHKTGALRTAMPSRQSDWPWRRLSSHKHMEPCTGKPINTCTWRLNDGAAHKERRTTHNWPRGRTRSWPRGRLLRRHENMQLCASSKHACKRERKTSLCASSATVCCTQVVLRSNAEMPSGSQHLGIWQALLATMASAMS